MSKISVAEVNKLRKTSGVGIMDCKKALTEANGDFGKALEILRKKGQKIAEKRADRNSSEGVSLATVTDNNKKGIIISLNCETDFVAKNDGFMTLAKSLASSVLNHDSKEDFLKSSFEGMTVKEKLIEQTGVIGEKIEIGNFEIISAPFVNFYIHTDYKITSLIGLSKNITSAGEVAKNVAMQVVAMAPIALNEAEVEQSIIDKEIEIAKEQLRKENKPEAMLDGIVKGKLKRFFKDNTLVNQSYIKDNKISVADYVESVDANLKVVGFKRVSLR